MDRRSLSRRIALLSATCLLPLCSAAAQPPVAGLAPYERPAGAPVITQPPAPEETKTRMLQGIPQPLPAGLGFAASQGAWYTPFDRPGMTGLYDLRGWHAAPAKARP